MQVLIWVMSLFLWSPFLLASDTSEIVIPQYSPKEQRCYEEIFRPSIGILRTLVNRSQQPDGDDDAIVFDEMINQSTIVREIAELLSDIHVDQLGLVLKRFTDYLSYEEKFVLAYKNHSADVTDTVRIGGGSAIIGIALAALGSVAELWQSDCTEYDCLDDDCMMLTTDQVNGQPYHYCALKGTDFDCLRYAHDVYGYNDLTDVTYDEFCSDNLDVNLINERIPLKDVVKSVDTVCRGLLLSLPYIPGALFFIPGIVLGSKSAVSFVTLKIIKYQLNNTSKLSQGVDGLSFIDGKNLVHQISPQLAEIINFVGNFYNLALSGQSYLDRLLAEDPIHVQALNNLQNSSLWQMFKRSAKLACCCGESRT